MSVVRDLAGWLVQLVAIGLHWVAASKLAIVLALVFVVLCAFWLFLTDRSLRMKVAKKHLVNPKSVFFGPLYVTSGTVLLFVGLFHVAANVISWFVCEGVQAYGPQGWVLGTLWMESLVPLPFAVALPGALFFYGYLYAVIFHAQVESRFRLHGSIVAYLTAFMKVPFLPLSFGWSLLVEGLLWVVRRGPFKKKKDDKVNVRKLPEEIPLQPPEIDGHGIADLMAGHEVLRAQDESKAGMLYFRLFPRFRQALHGAAALVFALTLLAVSVGFFLPSPRAGSIPFPETGAYEPFLQTTKRLLVRHGAKELGIEKGLVLAPVPFEQVFPSPTVEQLLDQVEGELGYEVPELPGPVLDWLREQKEAGFGQMTLHQLVTSLRAGLDMGLMKAIPGPVQVVVDKTLETMEIRLKLVEATSLTADYECDGTTYDKLKAHADRLERNRNDWAMATLNAALCRTVASPTLSLDDLGSADKILADLTAARFKAFAERRRELADVRLAAETLGSTPMATRAWLFAGLIHLRRFQLPAARRLLERAVKVTPEDFADMAARYVALAELCEILVKLNRFKDAEDLMDRYARSVRKAAGDQPLHGAFADFVDIQLAAVLVQTYRPDDALDILSVLGHRGEVGDEDAGRSLNPLQAHAGKLAGELELDEISNHRMKATIFIFGALPAGLCAAFLFFLVGLVRALGTPLSERPERKRPGKRRLKLPEYPVATPVEFIVDKLRTVGGFQVSQRMSLRYGKGGMTTPEGEMQQAVADAVVRVSREESKEATSLRNVSAAEYEEKSEGLPDEPSPMDLSEVGRPSVAFLRELLWQRGYLHATNSGQLYRHQEAALKQLDRARESRFQTTVMLMTARNSGRSTTALAAAIETIISHGRTVLYVCASRELAHAQAASFDAVRQLESWSWNLRACEGQASISDAVREGLPIHLLFADVETVHAGVLPVEQQHVLFGFLRNLGLVVVDDLHLFSQSGLAHGSFVMRRLAEVLLTLEQQPPCLVSMVNAAANPEDLVREFLGPLAARIKVVPESADDAPVPSSHDLYVTCLRNPLAAPFPDCGVEHMATAIVQGAGFTPDPDNPGERSEKTTWPAALVGYQGKSPEREDRVARIYHEMDILEHVPASGLHEARASVFPLEAASLAMLDATTRHGGIPTYPMPRRELDERLAVEGDPEPLERQLPSSPPDRDHTTFLVTGPEPVDEFIAACLAYKAREQRNQGSAGLVAEAFNDLKPIWGIARRNRIMNAYHFSCTLQERPAPGQRLGYLQDLFEADLLRELLQKETRTGRLDEVLVPAIDRERSRLVEVTHVWAPRNVDNVENLQVDSYEPEQIWIVDRTTHRRLLAVERSRCRLIYYPGRLFVAGETRMQILAPRYQNGWERGEWFAEPVQSPLRSSPIRTVRFRPEGAVAQLKGQWHGIGNGARFAVAFADNVSYHEEVLGCRVYSVRNAERLSRELHEPQVEEFRTEALLLGFGSAVLQEWTTPAQIRPILHGVTLLLRQVLPVVLQVEPDDLEICFGVGQVPGDARWVTEESGLPMHVESNQVTLFPYIAVIDRMAGALGYARLLHERLLQGALMKEWLWTALKLATWSQMREGDGGMRAYRTTLNYERQEVEEQAEVVGQGEDSPELYAVDSAGAAEFIRRLLGQDVVKPEWTVDAVPDEFPLTAEGEDADKGVRARRGVVDPLGLEEGEEALAQWLLPEFAGAPESPWGMSLLCVLKAACPKAVQQDVERLVMTHLMHHRRMTDDVRVGPPVGAESFRFYKPTAERSVSLDESPRLTDGEGLLLAEHYGELARAMGLLAADGNLSERGGALARSLLADTSAREVMAALVEQARSGQAPAENWTPARVARALCRAELPASSRRILGDGLCDVESVDAVGEAWRLTLGRNYQPWTIDTQLKNLAAGELELDDAVRKRYQAIHAYHAFDRACRTAIARLRVELSKPGRIMLRALAESPEGLELHELVNAAAAELTTTRLAMGRLPAAVKDFAGRLAKADSPERTIRTMLERLTEVCGDATPIRSVQGILHLERGWQKKRPVDNSRGLLFRLNCLGNFLSETRWHAAYDRLGLSAAPAGSVDPSEPVPEAWNEELPLPEPPAPPEDPDEELVEAEIVPETSDTAPEMPAVSPADVPPLPGRKGGNHFHLPEGAEGAVLEPLGPTVAAGTKVSFKVRAPAASAVYVAEKGKRPGTKLTRGAGGLHVGEKTVPASGALVVWAIYDADPSKYTALAEFDVK